MKLLPLIILPACICFFLSFQNTRAVNKSRYHSKSEIITGADQTEKYIPYLRGKRVGVLANPTTVIGKRPLVDSLLSRGISIVKIFGPEHGFRGNASNGAMVKDAIDSATGLPAISLYGPKRKPSKEDLSNVDVMIFDVQDVGCRFYTNINVLSHIMEACAENNKQLLILDRPNPNGYMVDGPVLDMHLNAVLHEGPAVGDACAEHLMLGQITTVAITAIKVGTDTLEHNNSYASETDNPED